MSGSVKVIDGEIVAHGPYIASTSNSRSANGQSYTFVAFRQSNGEEVSVKNVAATHEVGRFISVGTAGRFVLYPHQKANVLVAYKGSDLKHITTADEDIIVNASKNARRLGWLMLLAGIPLIVLFIGIFPTAFGLYILFVAAPKVKRPSDDAIRRALG